MSTRQTTQDGLTYLAFPVFNVRHSATVLHNYGRGHDQIIQEITGETYAT